MTTPGEGQQGLLPLPGTAGSTPLTPMSEQIETVKHGQLPSDPGGYDPNNPGNGEEQIQRAAYLHQSGQPQDPEPDHGGKGYEFDPETLPVRHRRLPLTRKAWSTSRHIARPFKRWRTKPGRVDIPPRSGEEHEESVG